MCQMIGMESLLHILVTGWTIRYMDTVKWFTLREMLMKDGLKILISEETLHKKLSLMTLKMIVFYSNAVISKSPQEQENLNGQSLLKFHQNKKLKTEWTTHLTLEVEVMKRKNECQKHPFKASIDIIIIKLFLSK